MSDFVHWVRHGIRRSGFQVSSRVAWSVVLTVAALTLFSGLYLGLVSRTAARGRHVEQLRSELAGLQRENEQLQVRVAAQGSVERLWVRAEELGFAPAGQVEYLLPAEEADAVAE